MPTAAVHQVMLRPAGHQGQVAEEVDIGANVLDQIVMGNDLLGEPVKLARSVHPRGAHVVERLNCRDKAKAVGQVRVLLTGQTLRAGIKRRLLGSDRFFDLISPHPKLDVTI